MAEKIANRTKHPFSGKAAFFLVETSISNISRLKINLSLFYPNADDSEIRYCRYLLFYGMEACSVKYLFYGTNSRDANISLLHTPIRFLSRLSLSQEGKSLYTALARLENLSNGTPYARSVVFILLYRL